MWKLLQRKAFMCQECGLKNVFLVRVTAVWVCGAGESVHVITPGFRVLLAVQQHLPHVSTKLLESGEQKQSVVIFRGQARRRPNSISAGGCDVIQQLSPWPGECGCESFAALCSGVAGLQEVPYLPGMPCGTISGSSWFSIPSSFLSRSLTFHLCSEAVLSCVRVSSSLL